MTNRHTAIFLPLDDRNVLVRCKCNWSDTATTVRGYNGNPRLLAERLHDLHFADTAGVEIADRVLELDASGRPLWIKSV